MERCSMSTTLNMTNYKQVVTTLMDTISAGVAQLKFDASLSFTYLNKNGAAMLGYTQEQLKSEINNEFIKLVYPNDQQSTQEFIDALQTNGYISSYKHRLVCRNGMVLWVHGAGHVYENKQGEKIGVITFMDITEYKEIENNYLQRVQELMLKKKHSELAIVNSDIVVLDYVLDGQQIVYPKFIMEKYGLPRKTNNAIDAIFSKNLIHHNSIEEVKRIFKEIHAGVPTVNAIVILLDKKNNNDEVIFDCSVTNVFDENRQPVRAVIVLRNITKQVLLENAEMYKQVLTAGNINTYEINVTNDTFISGAEYWQETLKMPNNSFSQMMELIKNKVIHEDDRTAFSGFMTRDSLLKLFESGKVTTTLEYRRLNSSGEYSWVSNTTHLIYDANTEYIKALSYIHDINDKKVRELKDAEKKYYYELMLSQSAMIPEINLTKDEFVVGYQKIFETFDIKMDCSYTEVVEELIQKIIYPEDSIIFRAKYSRESLLKGYQEGIKTISCEYRRKDEQENFIWFSCAMHLFEDIKTKDIKGFGYVQNINEEKVKHLELIYKSEHDALTTLCNKVTTEMSIKSFLSNREAENQQHAFLIFDIDYFKPINDNFGHAFGDVILAQVAKKVKKLFREGDIIGRIGGDEFVVFMKNVHDTNIALEKAAEICATVRESYRQKGKVYNISSSIGISLYNQHGITYQELYEHADAALYHSKEKGKNRYSLYSENMDYKKTSVQKIDQREYLESRSFENNVSEYVFRILYEAKNKTEAIYSIMELVGKHYKISRTYIYENSPEGLSMTFEWCNEGIAPQQHNLQKLTQNQLGGNYENYFNHEGILYIRDIRDMPQSIRTLWEPQGVKSMLNFSIVKEGVFQGFVGFDQHWFIRESSKKEITELKNIANLLTVFIFEIRASEFNEESKNMALSVVNSLYSYAYVVNCDTYELLFVNARAKEIAPDTKLGDPCYSNFWKREQPCVVCPMRTLIAENKVRHSEEIHNDNLEVWVKSSASWINWAKGQRCCMMENIDITEYKNQITAANKF